MFLLLQQEAFSIGQAVFHYIERLVGHDVVLRILEKMRTRLYRIVEPQALFFRSRFQTGDMLGVLSERYRAFAKPIFTYNIS